MFMRIGSVQFCDEQLLSTTNSFTLFSSSSSFGHLCASLVAMDVMMIVIVDQKCFSCVVQIRREKKITMKKKEEKCHIEGFERHRYSTQFKERIITPE